MLIVYFLRPTFKNMSFLDDILGAFWILNFNTEDVRRIEVISEDWRDYVEKCFIKQMQTQDDWETLKIFITKKDIE